MTWVRRGSTVLGAVLGLLFLGGSYAWAAPVTFQAETVCTGGGEVGPTAGATWYMAQADGDVLTCTITVPSASTGVVSVYGYGFDSGTAPTTIDGQAASPPMTFAGGGYGALIYTSPALAAGSHVLTFTRTSSSGYPYLDRLDVEATALPSPSPSLSPTPSSSAEPTPSDPPTSDTATVICGTTDAPCVMTWDEQQALGLWLFLGTGLLLSLTSFLLRHGRALRV